MENIISYQDIGRRIRMERQKRNMTQEELAEMAGVSCSFIGHIERGEKKASIETLASVSRAMKMDMHYMIFGNKTGDEQTLSIKREIMQVLEKYR